MKRYISLKEETLRPNSIDELFEQMNSMLESKSGTIGIITHFGQTNIRGRFKLKLQGNKINIRIEDGRSDANITLQENDLNQMTISKTNSAIGIWHDKYLMNTIFNMS